MNTFNRSEFIKSLYAEVMDAGWAHDEIKAIAEEKIHAASGDRTPNWLKAQVIEVVMRGEIDDMPIEEDRLTMGDSAKEIIIEAIRSEVLDSVYALFREKDWEVPSGATISICRGA